MTRTAIPVFNQCIRGPQGSGQDQAPDTTYITGVAGEFCFDLTLPYSIGFITEFMLLCDQRLPFTCPGSPQCTTNVTGFSAVNQIGFIPVDHDGKLFSYAFPDNYNKKYYQYFDSTLRPILSGYVFPRDTLF